MTPEQWEWIFGVNIFGVINGIRTLVPHMKGHGEAGHVVNTASIGGLQVNPNLRNGSYAMTKYAVVAASEALALDLQGSRLGVSLLCPAFVATTLHASSQRRPPRLGVPYQRSGSKSAKAWQSAGLSRIRYAPGSSGWPDRSSQIFARLRSCQTTRPATRIRI
jgi:NAD(P)-dependent dehydrogenase (short-subunit alcohol dehydrogenase family)